MEELTHFLSREVLGNPLYLWVLSLGLCVGLYVVLRIVLTWIGVRAVALSSWRASKVGPLFISLLSRFSKLFLFMVSVFVAAGPLELKPQTDDLLGRFLVLAFLVQLALWGNIVLRFWLDHVFARNGQDPATRNTIGLISSLAKGAMYALLVLLALTNLGVDITALVAGLGVGGIAVALAAQNILSDLFASLTIVLDRPFAVGDAIRVGDSIGTVEHIGLKTTRLRSASGEQLVFPNSHLLQNQIRNFRRMDERQVVVVLNLTYQTTVEKLERVTAALKEIVSAQPQARFDRAHFRTLGASSLDFELVYWITTPEYGVFMDTQQAVNFAILSRFQREGIDFAYPTQTLFLNRAHV